ncbi:MAG: hypothetical protein FWF56_06650 [Firmicutes bacterium]|nr:hypothetical protein [Bacillota bacterium]MCL1953131.1 hypothetical protein [Bacillota bacterium]
MKKSLSVFFNLIIGLAFLSAAILWLLGSLPDTEDVFGSFDFSWALVLATGVTAGVMVLYGIFTSNVGSYKRLYFLLGAIFAIVAVVSLISALTLPNGVLVPSIAVIAMTLVVICLVFTSYSKKWDIGDNQDSEYKNYYQRKAEQDNNNLD